MRIMFGLVMCVMNRPSGDISGLFEYKSGEIYKYEYSDDFFMKKVYFNDYHYDYFSNEVRTTETNFFTRYFVDLEEYRNNKIDEILK